MSDLGLPLLTAADVAWRFNVDRSWVYAHARELGVVRIGDGPRPRLRFDPRWSRSGSCRVRAWLRHPSEACCQ